MRYFIIERLFPSGMRRIKLEINGAIVDIITTNQNPKEVMRGMRIEHGLVHKKIIQCWL